MISDSTAKYLWDARRAADRVVRFTAGRAFDDYLSDEMLRAAVERQFEIIGEAFVCLRCVDPDVAAKIPDLRRAIALRNVLIHAYATVDNRLVWELVDRELAGLRAILERLLGEASAS